MSVLHDRQGLRSASISRRQLLKAGASLGAAVSASLTAGCGGSADPLPSGTTPAGGANPVAPNDASAVFQHGVASGDPVQNGVILWTRVSGFTTPVTVDWLIARNAALTDIVMRSDSTGSSRSLVASAERDYTVKIDVAGLQPGTTYYYRFTVAGSNSPIGRTRTAPQTASRLRFAVFACAKYHQAFWHPYRHAAQRADLDAVIHTGDYIYEEDDQGSHIEGRALVPNKEIYTLSDYRERHAFFKRDADLQAVHRQHPMICIWDDHELADNCWYGGAHRHDEAIHGAWSLRRAAAVRAYDEWMPIRTQATPTGKNPFERIYRKLSYGNLADLIMVDARLIGRDREVAGPASDSPRPANPMEFNDPTRSILGMAQFQWLQSELSSSTARWKLLVNQMLVGQLHAAAGLKASGGGVVINTDQWDGYRADQNRLIGFIRGDGTGRKIDNVVVITGDIHASFANDITDDPHNPAVYLPQIPGGGLPPAPLRAVAVEFVCPGTGSDSGAIGDLAPLLPPLNPHIRFVEAQSRGYMTLDLDMNRTQCEWTYVDTPDQRESTLREGPVWMVRHMENHLQQGSSHSTPPAGSPPLAP